MANIGVMSCFEGAKHPDFEEFAFESSQSLLEYDIVLWNIEFLHFGYFLSSGNRISELRRLLVDRRRRLSEIEVLLKNGKSLAILLSKSESLKIDLSERLGDFDPLLNPEISEIINSLYNHSDDIDTYSFLPPSIESLVRKYSVVARGKRMVCTENQNFSGVGKKLIGKAWYNAYFLQPIGFPILFLEGTQYPVACWIKYSEGNVFLLPGTEYDDSEDYPIFVKAVKELVDITQKIDLLQIEVPKLSSTVDTMGIWDEDMTYVDHSRLAELQEIKSDEFDLARLIMFCIELNKCFKNKCYLASAMLVRAILDHVPPILGYGNFREVANNYGGAGNSFREVMQHLENSSRKIANSYLHLQVRKKESLPNKTQVDFRSDLDVLLSEIVRTLK